jgi:hypothetical protein
MTDYSPQGSKSVLGTVVTKRTGTASADRVAAGSTVLAVNAGAGAHILTFTNTGTYTGLTIGNRAFTITAGNGGVIYVDPAWDGDGDGFVALGIDGTPGEVTFYVLGI